MVFIIILTILLLAFLGAPVFSLIGALAIYLFYGAGIDSSAVIVEMLRLASLPALIAIPLFTFSGYVLAESKAPQRMLALAEALFGFMPGGIGVVALFTTALFTAFTGASGVTIIALGGLLYPILKKQGYPEKFTLGLLTTTGSLGLLFPPSLPIILYALVAKIDIDKLFKAALLPGALLLAALSVYAVITARRAGIKKTAFSSAAVKSAARAAAWEIPLPFLIIGGIYLGLFTASEAASVMSFYVLVTEVFIYKDLSLFGDIPRVAVKSMLLVGAIFMVLGTALGLTNYLIDAQIPDCIFAWLHAFISSKIAFLIILNAFLLVINMIEIFSAIIIVVPIIVPIAAQYGIDPVHLGVIFLLNLEIGYMLPPLGLNLFLSSSRFNRKLPELYRAVGPFLLLLLIMLALITYLPQLSLITASNQ
ncbi:MAG: C4-dicarboxylate ABC transporter [Elusimicrobia bacterium GWC2_51_8]|nr:MAG: C4-dicarboxylate ABC transporter [Elusimicrobia bacterium GWA2_51_34]OGR58457.1 MAG: C4-dicarboxylate ABC transporter [Elusimicrobia bacterium GWC2_51_8]OGR87476.1 MAG: C4-dicarboxylate ABC transporter [Elusimicrobia bacterium GWF2_52_66]HAF94576.1 C4-dicarboxylate ABC transporter [Elusimicrobiota bacterium]HCE98090.1 C4-dicarboxylate ABC transporter [Elusimicrobiota bacterium]